ncbi:hypothetical protein KM043_002260 [Ampulex compressa]|nr:hypothetical protein KM043_002260 [Ampulex compressa]
MLTDHLGLELVNQSTIRLWLEKFHSGNLNLKTEFIDKERNRVKHLSGGKAEDKCKTRPVRGQLLGIRCVPRGGLRKVLLPELRPPFPAFLPSSFELQTGGAGAGSQARIFQSLSPRLEDEGGSLKPEVGSPFVRRW